MRRWGDLGINLIAQLIWVVLVGASSVALVVVFGTSEPGALMRAEYAVPAWAIGAAGLAGVALGLLGLVFSRRATAVRGREAATEGNVALFKARGRLPSNARVVLSTRFGQWPAAERLKNRSDFRNELDQAILKEDCEVRRIWNVSSTDDVARLRAVMANYRGRTNHSIRAYFMLPDHVMPELLVVERIGASLSFPSMKHPSQLDWMIRLRRPDLVAAVKDLFEVLWDRADRVFDHGEFTPAAQALLGEWERLLLEREAAAPS